jgi:hypothetical protein
MSIVVGLDQLSSVYVSDSGAVFLSWDDLKDDVDASDEYFGPQKIDVSNLTDMQRADIPDRGRVWMSGGMCCADRGSFDGDDFNAAKLVGVVVRKDISTSLEE